MTRTVEETEEETLCKTRYRKDKRQRKTKGKRHKEREKGWGNRSEIEGDRKNGRHKDRARGIDIKREKIEGQRRGSCLIPRIGRGGG